MATDVDPTIDHYRVLGVAATASAGEIKKAYRTLAKKFHPDSTGGDKAKEARFKDISNAYDVLGDDKKKARYDMLRSGGGGFGGGGFGGGGPAGGAQTFDMSDLFGQFFNAGGPGQGGGRVRVDNLGGRRQQQQAQRTPAPPTIVQASDGSELAVNGIDVQSDVRISFDRAMLGTVANVATISGKGEIKIPPGSSSGRKLRLRGKGLTDQSGKVGDHYVTIHIDVPAVIDDEVARLLTQFATRVRKPGHEG
jgi:DnaJ-class molecular chaperone